MQDASFEPDERNFLKLKTIKKTLKNLSKKKKKPISKNSLQNFLEIFGNMVSIQKQLFANFRQNSNSNNLILFLKELNSSIIYFLIFSKDKDFRNSMNNTFLGEFISQARHTLPLDAPHSEALTRLKLVYTFKLQQLLKYNFFIFMPVFESLLRFSLDLLQRKWQPARLQKASGLLLLQILKTFVFYQQPEQARIGNIYWQTQLDPDLQQKCYQVFHREIPQHLSQIAQNLVRHFFVDEGLPPLQFLEEQDIAGLETIHSELDASLFRIAGVVFQQLFRRFYPQTMEVFNFCLQQSTAQNNLSAVQRDSILALLGLLPDIYLQRQTPLNQRVDVWAVLQYLMRKFPEGVIYKRRFVVLVGQWKICRGEKTPQQVRELQAQFVSLLESNDEVVRYSSLQCLGDLIRADSSQALDYRQLVGYVFPLFADCVNKFRNPQQIIKMGQCLDLIFQKCIKFADPPNLEIIRNIDLSAVLRHEDLGVTRLCQDIVTGLALNIDKSAFGYLSNMAAQVVAHLLGARRVETLEQGLDTLGVVLRNAPQSEEKMLQFLFGVFVAEIGFVVEKGGAGLAGELVAVLEEF